MDKKPIDLYIKGLTDGENFGGCAALVRYCWSDEKEIRGGLDRPSSEDEMTMLALINGLACIKTFQKINVHTDNETVISNFNHLLNWNRGDWSREIRGLLSSLKSWQKFAEIMKSFKHEINFVPLDKNSNEFSRLVASAKYSMKSHPECRMRNYIKVCDEVGHYDVTTFDEELSLQIKVKDSLGNSRSISKEAKILLQKLKVAPRMMWHEFYSKAHESFTSHHFGVRPYQNDAEFHVIVFGSLEEKAQFVLLYESLKKQIKIM